MSEAEEAHLTLRADHIAARRLKDEMIVLDLRSSMYLSTNPAGTVLWEQLAHGATRSELIQALVEEFEISGERAAADVDAFLADCRRRDLLSEGYGASGA